MNFLKFHGIFYFPENFLDKPKISPKFPEFQEEWKHKSHSQDTCTCIAVSPSLWMSWQRSFFLMMMGTDTEAELMFKISQFGQFSGLLGKPHGKGSHIQLA